MIQFKLFILFHLLLISTAVNQHSIKKRSLLFPRATVLQFTYGISAPAILPSRSINLSLCVQANYDLPNNLTNLIQPKIVQAKANNNNFDLSREAFYKYIVGFLNSFGLNGEQCLYRLICEISEHPMHLEHRENLLETIVHFVFTPSLELSFNSSELFTSKLLEAEILGRHNGECGKNYSRCFISLADLFTAKYII
ncbi:hypothetical protein Zmor_018120 [Zophobas morio]|uniref:Uncharacterized protein n=1 Tax=Zophobas morio TaxID=2755281 RepID=A0AA38I9W9_9CUCU|nr:hypothetical protein Zmor_018120 [Zophobas morio]